MFLFQRGRGFAYSDYSSNSLEIDSVYLAADVMNILDNDSHIEDCTTVNQSPRNKKKRSQASSI